MTPTRSSWILALSMALAAAGCCKHTAGGGPGGGGLKAVDGLAEAAPNPMDFGTVGTGTTHQKPLTVTNGGAGPLTLLSATVKGDASFVAALPQGKVSLLPGASVAMTVTFAPQSDGSHQATLTLATDSGETPAYPVTLTGSSFSYSVSVTPSELDFGEVQVQTQSAPQTVTVTNGSSAAETITVTPPGGDFQATPSGPQANVAPGTSFTVSVVFAPTATQAEQAQLSIAACDGCAPVTVALTGTGVDTQLVVMDQDTNQPYVQFNQPPAGQPTTAHVVVTATGLPASAQNPLVATLTAPPSLKNGTAGLTLTPTDASFAASPWPAALTPGGSPASAYFLVTYTAPSAQSTVNDVALIPYSVGSLAKTAQLPITSGASGSPCQQVTASPPQVAFGTVLSGRTAQKTVTLANNGPSTCVLSGIDVNPNDAYNEFALAGGAVAQLALGPGQSQALTVSFAPANGSPPLQRNADLSMQTSDPLLPAIKVPLTAAEQNPAYAATAWPKWHHDNANTGYTTADTSGNQGKVAWKVSLGAPVGAPGELATYIHSPAIGKDANSGDDVVYMLGFGSYNINNVYQNQPPGAGQLVAVDGPSGSTIWSTPVTGPENSAQEATPTIVADGSIFLMSGGEQTSYPEFFHVGANGSILWSGVQAVGGTTCPCSFDASGQSSCVDQCGSFKINDGFDTCPGLDANGVLYLFDDDQPGCDAYTGIQSGAPTLKWSAKETQQPAHVESFSGALTDTSQSVFSWGGFVVSFDPQGNQLWGMKTGNGQMTTGWAAKGQSCENDSKGSPLILGNDAVVQFSGYDTSCSNVVGGIVGVNLQTGGQDWGMQLPSMAPPAAPYVSKYHSATVGYSSPAALGDGGLVMGYLDGVYAFDPPSSGQGNATQRWRFPTGLVLGSPAVGGDGTVFVGSTDGNFYAIDGQSGQLKWKFNVGQPVNSSPAIGSDGTVYFAADDGNLYALR